MERKLKLAVLALVAASVILPVAGQMPDVAEIVLPGEYAGHLQDVWWDGGENIYWAHTWDIVKTDLSGNILRQVAVEGHNAGCQLKDGKLYVAVCPTANKSIVAWGPDSRLQVNEYDAETLALVAARNGHEVRIWGPDAEYLREVERTRMNPRFLPGVKFAPGIRFQFP